jgi:hypothetical protein
MGLQVIEHQLYAVIDRLRVPIPFPPDANAQWIADELARVNPGLAVRVYPAVTPRPGWRVCRRCAGEVSPVGYCQRCKARQLKAIGPPTAPEGQRVLSRSLPLIPDLE